MVSDICVYSLLVVISFLQNSCSGQFMNTFPLPGMPPQQQQMSGAGMGLNMGGGMSPPQMGQQMMFPRSFQGQGFPPQGQQQRMPLPSMTIPGMGMPQMNGYSGGGRPRQLAALPTNFQKDVHVSFQPQQPLPGSSQTQPQPETAAESSSGSLPKFLEGVDEALITQFKSILRLPGKAYNDKIKQIEAEIVPQLDEAHKTLYQQFMSESDSAQQSKRDTIHQTVNGMSAEAQQEFTKIQKVLNAQGISEDEKWSQITSMYNGIDSGLRDEFESKFKPLAA